MFAIPYEGDFTLIGTTDVEHDGAPGEAVCTAEERDYLLGAVAGYFREPPGVEDIVWSYAGVRPLYDDGASSATAATRDYVITVTGDGAPAVDVFGGKITTYRRLAEAAMAKLAPFFPADGAGVDGAGWRCRAATSRSAGRGGCGGAHGAVSVPRRALGGAAGARLRHRGGGDAGGRRVGGGARRAVRLGPDRARRCAG